MTWYTVTARAPENRWCQLLVLARDANDALVQVRETYEFRAEFELTVDRSTPDSIIVQTGGNVIATHRRSP